jgi:transcriptional regulator with GAF, ATPase, and Fis domain
MEHIIERAVIASTSVTLELGTPLVSETVMNERRKPVDTASAENPLTAPEKTSPEKKSASEKSALSQLEETERQLILTALKKSGGRVRGNGGAAEQLGMKPTTLEYRMKKLGIRKEPTAT